MSRNRTTIRGTWDCNDLAWTEPQTEDEIDERAAWERDEAARAENAYWERRLEAERSGDWPREA